MSKLVLEETREGNIELIRDSRTFWRLKIISQNENICNDHNFIPLSNLLVYAVSSRDFVRNCRKIFWSNNVNPYWILFFWVSLQVKHRLILCPRLNAASGSLRLCAFKCHCVFLCRFLCLRSYWFWYSLWLWLTYCSCNWPPLWSMTQSMCTPNWVAKQGFPHSPLVNTGKPARYM